MVSKKERFAEVEDCLKELTSLLPAEGEVRVDSFSSENKERFYALVSKYASFKQDPALKSVVENLETKYNVSGAFRSQVEDYINRRKELVEKEKAEAIVDHEQQLIEDREEKAMKEAAQEQRLSFPELEKLAATMGQKLDELIVLHKRVEKVEAVLIEEAKKDPEKAEIFAVYVAEVVPPRDQEAFYSKFPEGQRAKFRKKVEDFRKKMEKGAPPVFVPPVKPGDKFKINPDATLPDGRRVGDIPRGTWKPYLEAADVRAEYSSKRDIFVNDVQNIYISMEGLSIEQQQSVLTTAYGGGAVTVGKMIDAGIPSESVGDFRTLVKRAMGPKDAKDHSSQKNPSSRLNPDSTNEKPDNDTQAKPSDPLEVISLKNAELDRKKTQADTVLAKNSSDSAGVDVAQTVARHAEENITQPEKTAPVVENQQQQGGRA